MSGWRIAVITFLLLVFSSACDSSPDQPHSAPIVADRSSEVIAIVNRSYVRNENKAWHLAKVGEARERAYQYDVYEQCNGQCWIVLRSIPFLVDGDYQDLEFQWAVMPEFRTADPNNTVTSKMYTRTCYTGC